MKNILIAFTVILASVFCGCKKKDITPPDLSSDFPRILSEWPGKQSNGNIGAFNIEAGKPLELKVLYTPSSGPVCTWYIDGEKKATGNTYTFTLSTEGTYYVKCVVVNGKDSTLREANINVIDPTAVKMISRNANVVATASGICSDAENPNMARDGIYDGTKWCDGGAHDKWLQYDLQSVFIIKKVILDWENWDINAKYKIQVSSNGTNWTDIVTETSNTLDPKEYEVNISGVRYIRFWVAQADDDVVRLMEFEVWGSIR